MGLLDVVIDPLSHGRILLMANSAHAIVAIKFVRLRCVFVRLLIPTDSDYLNLANLSLRLSCVSLHCA